MALFVYLSKMLCTSGLKEKYKTKNLVVECCCFLFFCCRWRRSKTLHIIQPESSKQPGCYKAEPTLLPHYRKLWILTNFFSEKFKSESSHLKFIFWQYNTDSHSLWPRSRYNDSTWRGKNRKEVTLIWHSWHRNGKKIGNLIQIDLTTFCGNYMFSAGNLFQNCAKLH